MDELYQSLLIAKSALNDFVESLNGVYANLGDEYEQLPKDNISIHEIKQTEKDLSFIESFLGVTAPQMQDYLQNKINILNMFLYEE